MWEGGEIYLMWEIEASNGERKTFRVGSREFIVGKGGFK